MSETEICEQWSEDGSCSRGDGDHQSLILFTLRNRGVYLQWQKRASRGWVEGTWGKGTDRLMVGSQGREWWAGKGARQHGCRGLRGHDGALYI